jgi:hypothetical protein
MKSVSSQTIGKTDISNLPVVRKFRTVIESRDMNQMDKELYQFLHQYCGFIAHSNIYGFRETYTAPRSFADVFIRHFDRDHRYFCSNYACHCEHYQSSGFTKAEIKQEFFRIVERHKDAIGIWANDVERDKRYSLFRRLKNEFEPNEARA